MIIIITSKISKKIGGIITSKIFKRDRWEYLDQKYSKGSVGIIRSKIFKENTIKLCSFNV